MTTSRKPPPASVAIFAALILLVQTFLSGAWMGAQATAGPLDAFGNVICTTHTGGVSQTGGHDGKGYNCDCCVSCCHSGTAVVPEANGVEPVSAELAPVLDGKRLVEASFRRHELQPLSSRGPPA